MGRTVFHPPGMDSGRTTMGDEGGRETQSIKRQPNHHKNSRAAQSVSASHGFGHSGRESAKNLGAKIGPNGTANFCAQCNAPHKGLSKGVVYKALYPRHPD